MRSVKNLFYIFLKKCCPAIKVQEQENTELHQKVSELNEKVQNLTGQIKEQNEQDSLLQILEVEKKNLQQQLDEKENFCHSANKEIQEWKERFNNQEEEFRQFKLQKIQNEFARNPVQMDEEAAKRLKDCQDFIGRQENVIKELREKLDASLKNEKNLNDTIAEIQKETEDQKQQFQVQIYNLEQTNELLKKQYTDLETKNNTLIDQIQDLKEHKIPELEEEVKNKEELRKSLEESFNTYKNDAAEIQKQYQYQINDLNDANAQWADAYAKLESQHNVLTDQLQDLLDNQIPAMRQKYQESLQEKDNQLQQQKRAYEDALNRMKTEFDAEKDEMLNLHQKQMQEKSKQIADLCNTHQNMIEELKKSHKQEIDRLNSEHSAELLKENNRYAAAMKEKDSKYEQLETFSRNKEVKMKTEHENALDACRKECDKKVSLLKEENRKSIEMKNSEMKALRDEEERKRNRIFDDFNILLGRGVVDKFRTEDLAKREIQQFHLFLSLLHNLDQENSFVGVQNIYLLMDELLKDKYRQQPVILTEKRKFIREVFNANVKKIQIEKIPEAGDKIMNCNLEHYTIRGKGSTVSFVETPALLYESGDVRRGLILCQ